MTFELIEFPKNDFDETRIGNEEEYILFHHPNEITLGWMLMMLKLATFYVEDRIREEMGAWK